MHIREATSDDGDELENLQEKCPQGATLVVSTVNTPDFFARAKAYESYRVYVACEDNRIIGSAACAIREAFVNSSTHRIGYEFQYFTSPDCRGRSVAKQLHQHIEDYLIQKGVALSYLLVIEGNRPAMRLFEGQGFKHHRTLVMPAMAAYKEMRVASGGKIRPAVPEDLGRVAELLNNTWQGYDLYEPTSAEALERFIAHTPAYSFNSLLILEDKGEISACLGCWDWSKVMRITVKARSLRLHIMGFLLDLARRFRPLPRIPESGEILKQWCLTPIAFKKPEHLKGLLRYVNNQAIIRGVGQVFCICERDHALLSSMNEFIHVDTEMHLYVRQLQPNVSMGSKPVFINGIDL